jgi:hypothetical protein
MTAYICTPYRAETPEKLNEHIEYAQAVSRAAALKGYSVITPHLYYPYFLDDENEEEREIGMALARGLIKKCDVVIVGKKYGISDGMKSEIEYAEKIGVGIHFLK